MEIFNSREIAATFWILILVIWMASKKKMRLSLLNLVKAALAPKLVQGALALATYTCICVYAFEYIGLWNWGLLKDTILWYLFSGIVLAFETASSKSDAHKFKDIALDNLKLILIFEFFVTLYTFSLPIEIILVPVVVFVAGVGAVSKTDSKYKDVEKIVNVVEIIFGSIIIVFSIYKTVAEIKSLGSLDTLRSFLLAPALSISSIPFVYLLALAAEYEIIFMRIRFFTKDNPELRAFAKRKVILSCLLNYGKLKRLSKQSLPRLFQMKSKQDIDQVLKLYPDKIWNTPQE